MKKKGELIRFKLNSVGGIFDGIEGEGVVEEVTTGGYNVNVGGSRIYVSASELII